MDYGISLYAKNQPIKTIRPKCDNNLYLLFLLLLFFFLQNGRAASKRGTGVSFGPDITQNFLDRNGLGRKKHFKIL